MAAGRRGPPVCRCLRCGPMRAAAGERTSEAWVDGAHVCALAAELTHRCRQLEAARVPVTW